METAIGVGFLSVPVIVMLIQLLKRIVGLSGKVWLATSFILGVASQILLAVAMEAPVDFAGWLMLTGAGIVNGLAASKAYDELIDRG